MLQLDFVRLISKVLRRALQLLVLSVLVTSVTFLLSSLIPGDYFTTQRLDPTIRPEIVDQLRHRYGLDQPVYVQYARWLGNCLKLDLGFSLFYRAPVSEILLDALAKTLWLGLPALVLGFGGGVLIGTLHGIYRRRPAGYLLDLGSTVALSLPSLVLGLLALLFAARTGWFPLGSMSALSPGSTFWSWLIDRIHHLALPVTCLTLPILAYVERIQCAATQDSLEQLCVRSARSRGLGSWHVFLQYNLRPSLNPVLSVSGPIFGAVLSGSLVLEVIFAWPGLGKATYDALFNRDIFLLVGCVVGSSMLLVTGNMAADVLLLALDPRIRDLNRGVKK